MQQPVHAVVDRCERVFDGVDVRERAVEDVDQTEQPGVVRRLKVCLVRVHLRLDERSREAEPATEPLDRLIPLWVERLLDALKDRLRRFPRHEPYSRAHARTLSGVTLFWFSCAEQSSS